MSSFVNDNVSESKKPEQQINEYQEKSTEITTDVTTATKINQLENTITTTATPTTTSSINNDDIKNKIGEKNIEHKKTINENQSEQTDENATIASGEAAALVAETTTTANNYENNESNNDDALFAIVSIAKSDDSQNVAMSVDNNTSFQSSDENNLITAQQITNPKVAALPAALYCPSNMKRADVGEHQTQEKPISDKQQTIANFTINRDDNETSIAKPNPPVSLLTGAEEKPLLKSNDVNECNVNPPSMVILQDTTTVTNTSPLPPLPPGLTSSLAGSHLPHISSDPTFGVQLRNINSRAQQHNTNNSNNTNSPIKISFNTGSVSSWRPDTSAPNFSSAIKAGTVSASASPNMVRKTSESSVLLPRRVSFPKSDNELVTGYLEPANPWEHVYMVKSISEIAELYITSCQKHNTKPLQSILDHLKAVDLTKQLRRQPLLSLKSIKLAPSDCEALEEVLKRVQYKAIDISDCKLDETAASALFDMIEYYEATHELDISSNAMGMTHRGWTSCIYMISHSQELQVLNAEGNPISKLSADHLGNALSTSNLHTLKLEHCGLKGAPLSGLCFKLWQNKVLKELWLAHNDLDCNDADTIAEMLKCNHYLELIDISNNNIRDEGLRHIVKALIMQSKELERRTTFQRTAAIDDDDDCESPVNSSPPVHLGGISDDAPSDWKTREHEVSAETQTLKANDKCDDGSGEKSLCKDSSHLPLIEEKAKEAEAETSVEYHEHHKVKPPLISSVGSTIDENDGDEDTDETVRSSTIKNPLQSSSAGQSMLDKLLSMNSESSSDDGASNLSTDTLAACNSEDASLISDEIFDSAATTTTTTSTNTKAPTNATLEVISLNDGADSVTSAIVKSPAKTPASLSAYSGGKEEATVFRNPSLDCTVIERNKVKVDDSDIVLVNSPSNLDKSSGIQITHVVDNNCSNNNNINNNNPATKTINMPPTATQTSSVPGFSTTNENENLARSDVFEVTADDGDCMLSSSGVAQAENDKDVELRSSEHTNVMQHHSASRALDVNKNTKLAEDFDDTHSTDSAFESASEGDISRHLPEEFTRLSTSLESSRFDDIAKELAIETATIASESNECLIAAAAQVTPSSTPTPPTPPFSNLSTPLTEKERLSTESSTSSCLSSSLPTVTTAAPSIVKVGFAALGEPSESTTANTSETRDKMPKVTIAQDSFTQKYKTNSGICASPSPIPTPPPPSTSPGGASSSLRRTETSCGFLTQSSRNCSQSTDSLCSDNSLDGSIGSGDLNFSSSHLNDKITKNDTLTRQQRPTESTTDFGTRTPGGLKALAVWNNSLTKESGYYISDLLAETVSLELLNIGKNCLSNEFVSSIKDSLTKNTTLTTLGLQSAHLSAKGIETLSSILTFGGNSTLQRIDIRDNKLEVESLNKISEVLKSNTTVTQIDIDDEPKRLSVGSEAHLDYARILENVRSMCSRNEKAQTQIQQEKSAPSVVNKKRGGYYLGSRKISLTCQSRPVIDTTKNVVVSAPNSKLDIKRKASTRLRSPVPSPTTISPSSSPNRASRFQVFRVAETSPLTSPSTYKPTGSNLVAAKAVSISSATLPLSSAADKGGNDSIYQNITSTSLPTSCSLPSMATISSSTQSVKRMSVSPRSRFLVRKVYEDPNLPLANRFSQSITPPISLSPTPIISRDTQGSTTTRCSDGASKPSESAGLHQDSLANNSKPDESARATTPSTTTNVRLPTIITQQQQVNTTTTDTTSTAILNISEEGSPAPITAAEEKETSIPASKTIITKQCEQSTNETIINDSNITNQTQTTTMTMSATTTTTPIQTSSSTTLLTTGITVPKSSSSLQPSSPILSTLSSSSDSTSSASSSSSSSSTSPASNTDSSDSSSPACSSIHSNEILSQQQQHDLTVSGQCPIAVFSDNDITLTKNTVNEFFGPVAAAAKENFGNIVDTSNENSGGQQTALVQQPEHQQQRVRKISWISNPTAVDKLLTLFHNSTTIFQRSSSPETKPVATSTSTTADIQLSQSPPTYAETAAAACLATQQSKSQSCLVPLRKQSPPSWTRLGNDIISAAAANNIDLANTVATTAAAVVTEQSRSFFDAASKQFRDLSKQVFRQNLSFGNEPVATASTSNTIMTTVSALNVQPTASESAGRSGEYCKCDFVGPTGACLCGGSALANTDYNADCLPTEMKQEIKENISPEHTINEETLHSMQKICGSSAALISAITTITAPSIALDTKVDNMDWLIAKDTSTNTAIFSAGSVGAATQLTTTTISATPTTQTQHLAVAENSGIESEFQAHNN